MNAVEIVSIAAVAVTNALWFAGDYAYKSTLRTIGRNGGSEKILGEWFRIAKEEELPERAPTKEWDELTRKERIAYTSMCYSRKKAGYSIPTRDEWIRYLNGEIDIRLHTCKRKAKA